MTIGVKVAMVQELSCDTVSSSYERCLFLQGLSSTSSSSWLLQSLQSILTSFNSYVLRDNYLQRPHLCKTQHIPKQKLNTSQSKNLERLAFDN
ncbi:hypothetical protein EUTSA_v10017478mg [Eutrema salsugineum]|uniref:Uncharacterized protein n=1 Tax=Eutrema salsugineum TaxID=72664 RepID=V4M905_EUTSA|nr:hypothetical protein EUTSA_v10017478mg [Eutrema salsugineum]